MFAHTIYPTIWFLFLSVISYPFVGTNLACELFEPKDNSPKMVVLGLPVVSAAEQICIPLPGGEKEDDIEISRGQLWRQQKPEYQITKYVDPQKIIWLPQKVQRGHFIIYHDNKNFADEFSWKAEYHYKRILRHIGDPDFKPWEGEKKCRVYLYKTPEDYRKASGAPAWSGGLARYDLMAFFTFESAPNLFTNILPHEMTHLLMKLYMGKTPIPLWLNEGLARYEEEKVQYKPFIKRMVIRDNYIPCETLFKMTCYPTDKQAIALFYAQSASLIDYLRQGLISSYFSRLLAELKKGKPIEEALENVYQWKFKKGISDLEKRWVKYVKENY